MVAVASAYLFHYHPHVLPLYCCCAARRPLERYVAAHVSSKGADRTSGVEDVQHLAAAAAAAAAALMVSVVLPRKLVAVSKKRTSFAEEIHHLAAAAAAGTQQHQEHSGSSSSSSSRTVECPTVETP
jgi:hypothetical protein